MSTGADKEVTVGNLRIVQRGFEMLRWRGARPYELTLAVFCQERDEADLPTKRSTPFEAARFSTPYGDARRQGDFEGSPKPWPRESLRLSGRPARVRGRQAFLELGRSRSRAASGSVRVHFAPADEVNPGFRVAYSVSRKVGSAVVRNRWRRRLRAVAAGVAGELPPGAYLVVLGPEINRLSFGDLQERVVQTMRRASELRP